MNKLAIRIIFLFSTLSFFAQSQKVTIHQDNLGQKLMVDGQPFMINGMNWGYVPIGTNVLNNFWNKPDAYIKAALDTEMLMLQNMGVNTIRQYTGVPARWITYIYDNYGIYTMLNHSFGRYGLTIDGVWYENTEYSDPKVQQHLLTEAEKLARDYKDTPGLLLFLLGNENNYGLSWGGAETEDIPIIQKGDLIKRRARSMYQLFNKAALAMKAVDLDHPIAICNGDLLYLDIVAEECKNVDIYGTNMYRGVSFSDAFERVKNEFGKPIMFTEFGADAFNAVLVEEDQYSQAYYMTGNWKEIYANAAGLGKSGNSIGGFTFQFSDGWWKYGFNDRKNADVHDINASWANGGYARDHKEGQNNMNEEWFGICAKGKSNARGLYQLYPRAAYYALKEAHHLNPYQPGMSAKGVAAYFSEIQLMEAVLKARGDNAALGKESSDKISLSRLSAQFTTFNTGGSLLTTPEIADPTENTFPNQTGFDHMESYFIGVEAKPAENMRANVQVSVLGNVADNPINEIFYENRGRAVTVNSDDGNVVLEDANRVKVYNAEFEWKEKDFDLKGFYRTGHYHWQYEGDFFGLYPEANYGPNLDIYNGEISGLELSGKNYIKGFKAAFGPQLWWGANPAVLLKYGRKIGHYEVTGVYHKDLVQGNGIDADGNRILNEDQVRTGVIPPLPTERLGIHIERDFKDLKVELGGIWAGRPLNDRAFQYTTGTSGNYQVFTDRVDWKDNWGAKAKVTMNMGAIKWYAQGAIMGLVANGGSDNTITLTGWKLKDTGSGNQSNFLTGVTYNFGDFQIAPNFLWQKPIVGPMPNDVEGPGRLRNFIQDPFAVRGNRETTAGEILFSYDPTPATWMYQWDNDRTEDAPFAANLGFVYRHLPTTQDAAIGFLADRSFFAFQNSAPANDLWEVNSRLVSKINPDFGMIANLYGGNAQANGDSDRTIERFGGDLRVIYKRIKAVSSVKVNDWGPFDYHRDFNLTYPLQLMLDISTTLGKPDWFVLPNTKVGIRGTWRSLNQFSPRYSLTQVDEFAPAAILPTGIEDGSEWEIRTYVHINIGK